MVHTLFIMQVGAWRCYNYSFSIKKSNQKIVSLSPAVRGKLGVCGGHAGPGGHRLPQLQGCSPQQDLAAMGDRDDMLRSAKLWEKCFQGAQAAWSRIKKCLIWKLTHVVASNEPVPRGDLALKDTSRLPIGPAVRSLERGTQTVPDFYSGTRSFPRKLLLLNKRTRRAVLLMLNHSWLVPAGPQLLIQYASHEEGQKKIS